MNATKGLQCAVVAPHALAAQAGKDILCEGGNAIEAIISAAAAIAVLYPHMNSIGGDGFWLIRTPDGTCHGVEGCGRAGTRVTRAFYLDQKLNSIPARGPLAANTVAGTVASWVAASKLSAKIGGRLPIGRLLEPAIHYALSGAMVSESQARLTQEKYEELAPAIGFSEQYLADGKVPLQGDVITNERLARSLQSMAVDGIDSFYRGKLAKRIATDLAIVGSPLQENDLARFEAQSVEPLSIDVRDGILLNLPPPTQGLTSLMILGMVDRMKITVPDGFEFVHACVEATKQAFSIRDAEVGEPDVMRISASQMLAPAMLDNLVAKVNSRRASEWMADESGGDTVWLGAVDSDGCVVSFIQSVFWEFGSGVVLPETGILWQNRGSSFSLAGNGVRSLAPGRRPFHTLNPAMALLDDGRVMAYGTMGGDGQPQTQAAIFTRYIRFNQSIQQAVDAPRWLLGRTWGEQSMTLKLESRFSPEVYEELRAAGHPVEQLGEYDDCMGHAGAVVRHAGGLVDGAADPRSDGALTGI